MLDLLYKIGVHVQLTTRERMDVLKLIINKEELNSLKWYLDKVKLRTDDNPFDIDPYVLLYCFRKRRLEVFDYLTREETFLSFFWSYHQEELPYNSIDFFLLASSPMYKKQFGWVHMFNYLSTKKVTIAGEIVNLFRIEKDHLLTQRVMNQLAQSYGQTQNTFVVRLAKFGFLLNDFMLTSYRIYWRDKLNHYETNFKLYYATLARCKLPKSFGLRKSSRKKFYKSLKWCRVEIECFLQNFDVAILIFEFLCGDHYCNLR